MEQERAFECLRCEHHFVVTDYDAKVIVERACPQCGSNSVRPATKVATAPGAAPGQPT